MAIPGIELSERPWAGSADSRLFASDPGPGNPNVGRETLRSPPATPSAPTAAPAPLERPSLRAGAAAQPGGLGKATYLAGRAVEAAKPIASTALRLGGATAALGHLGDYRIDDPDVDSSAMGTLRAAGQGDFAGVGRSLSKGMLEAGMDLGSMAANAADLVMPGKNTVSSAYDRSLRSAFGDQLIGGPGGSSVLPAAQAGTQAPTATPAPTPASTPVAPVAPAAAPPTSSAAAPATPSLRADVTRVGNSYTGAPNITGNITVNGDAPGGGSISPQNLAAADNLAARDALRSATAGAGGASIPGRPAMAAPGNSDNSWQARNNLRNLEVSAKSITNQQRWGGEGSRSADVQAYQQALAADTALRGGMDAGSVARTNAQATMYGDDVRANAARYTSDNSLRGQLATAGATRASADARLRYDMGKDARDFGMRVQENDLKRQESQLKQREASEKSVYDQILNTLPPGPDGKPNAAGAAEYMRGLSARVADRQAKLEAHLTANPGDRQAKAELQNIMDNGVGALGMQGKDKFLTGMEAKSLRTANAGMTPWTGKDVATNQPITSLRRDPGLLWDDYVDNQGGRIPAYAVDKEGSFLGFGGRSSNKFDSLKER